MTKRLKKRSTREYRQMPGGRDAKTAKPPAAVYADATIVGVMVGGQWFPVGGGTWVVDLRGPYLHAEWRDTSDGTRYSAFISQVQMVKHAGGVARKR